jgi:hypothetical protein
MTRDIKQSPNWYGPIFVGMVFGGLHCVAWNFEFPTLVEKWIWRMSGLMIVFISLLGWYGYWWRSRKFKGREYCHKSTMVFFNWVYVLVRLFLMAEVFLEFRGKFSPFHMIGADGLGLCL